MKEKLKTIKLDLTCDEASMKNLLAAAGCAAIVIPDSHYGCYVEVYVSERIADTVFARLIKERKKTLIDGSISIMEED